jgi:hypothetical protein
MQWLVSWWNFVFHSMMGGSIVLMFLFGWEIFLIPITLGIGVVLTVFAMIWQLVFNRKS